MLQDIVTKDSTDRSVTIRIMDSTTGLPETAVEHNTAGIDLWYRREGAAKVSITEAALAALTTAHTDGGIEHIADGEYRLDLPDAAFADGANYVDFGGTVTDMVVYGGRVRLVDVDLETSLATAANLATVDTVVDGIKAVTDQLPDAGALTSLATAANLATVDTVVDGIKAVTDQLPDAGALTSLATAASLATAQADLDILTGVDGATLASNQANYTPATAADLATHDSNLTVGVVGLIGDAQADLDILTGVDGATLATAQANYAPATAASLATVDTNVDTLLTNLATVDGLVDQLVAQVVTASSEPGQVAPPVSASMQEKINWLYKAWRNKTETVAAEYRLYNDAGTVVDNKAAHSDDGTTYTRPVITAGP